MREDGLKCLEDEHARHVVASVEEQRAEHGFIGVGEDGRALAAAVEMLAAAEDEVFAKPEQTALLGKRNLVHKLRADLRERAFIVLRVAVVKLPREHQLKHGVTEVFEALVVILARAQLVRDGGMRQRRQQRRFINWARRT
jgi:hypothetical protein